MIPQSEGKMFLATERGYTETDWFRSYNTFQFGNFKDSNKQPFHQLYVLNNDTLAGGKSFSLRVEEDSDIILIPTVGAIMYSDTSNHQTTIEVGQAQRFTTSSGTTITLTNPYEEDPINFLQVWIQKQPGEGSYPLQVADFDIETNKNRLVTLFGDNTDGIPRFCMGKLGGREEVKYATSDQSKGLFVYVLEGAFEVAFRLLETGDGLALWNIEEVEMEALSNDALILLMEL